MDQRMHGVILGLVLVLIQSAYTHVEENGCQLHDTYIHCKGSQKVVLPSVDISNVESIFFTSCNLSLLTYEDFAPFPHVINIEIRSSNLSFPTNKGLFNKVKDLKYLRVENCEVGEEVVKLLPENESLERLSFPQNRITSISRRLLRNLTGLQELDLSGNGATHLEDGAFDELKELRVLDLRNNALKGGSAGVVALAPDRCSVCRPPGVSVGCYKTDVDQCVAGRPLDRLWWRSSGLTLQLEGNPVCNESPASKETESSAELYYGDVECDIQEEECSKQESREVFLKEACGKKHAHSSNDFDRGRYVLAGITTITLYTTGIIVVGIVIGALFASYIIKKNRDQGRQFSNILGNNMNYSRVQSDEESGMLLEQMEPRNRADTSTDHSPVHSAALKGDLKTLKRLKEEGIDLTTKNSRGESALWCAAHAGQHKVVRFILNNYPEEVHSVNQNGDTPLHVAAEERNEISVKVLLAAGAKRSAKNKYGSTPLHMAVSRETMGIIELLLKDTECINETNAKGETPLSVAVGSGQIDAVKLLLDKGADVKRSDISGILPIQIAAWNGNERMVRLLLGYDFPIDSCDVNGTTTLHDTCRKGHVSIVKCLLDKGSNVNARTKRGKTPLHKAVKGDHAETVELLLERGADVNAKNAKGLTALEYAREKGNTKCIETITNFLTRK